ncbi:hypothetical protein QJS04_geneDACA020462 [Acorus gramineus]|uniref:Uncharacterized protein n=1 Tax=Acorus gramineus TaxID=55184 RepID=A0AAV9ADA7_ACOGR|nr:hypothetical protein QJS04_geneDACA020462 [Acorus gramineus]
MLDRIPKSKTFRRAIRGIDRCDEEVLVSGPTQDRAVNELVGEFQDADFQ